jgi:hypothetical protein
METHHSNLINSETNSKSNLTKLSLAPLSVGSIDQTVMLLVLRLISSFPSPPLWVFSCNQSEAEAIVESKVEKAHDTLEDGFDFFHVRMKQT